MGSLCSRKLDVLCPNSCMDRCNKGYRGLIFLGLTGSDLFTCF